MSDRTDYLKSAEVLIGDCGERDVTARDIELGKAHALIDIARTLRILAANLTGVVSAGSAGAGVPLAGPESPAGGPGGMGGVDG